MIMSMKWLADYVDVSDVPIRDFCEEITLTGSKVEGYKLLNEEISGVIVGKILSTKPHEDSDHLIVCSVDVGADAPLQIVTGAQNVKAGDVVPVAANGSSLPGGIKIKTGKLRGVVSEGMLCSVGELGLTTHDMPGAIENGILILNDVGLADAPLGEDICKVLMMDDTAVEFEITSNRPDCLSMRGLAREAGVTFSRQLNLPEAQFPKDSCDGDKIENYISVDIDDKEHCYRYSAKVVKNVRIAPSPLWLRMRLRACGVRPINNIVDITNYVMLEYGQPMHAFDYKCIDGKHIIVRAAGEGEKYISLDEEEHTLKSSMLVIADEKKPVALAGVMGGANSGISDDTATVVFESAMFHPGCVRKAAKALGMRTESSGRFEKGLDTENTIPALKRACELVKLLGAGDVVDGLIDVYPEKKETVYLPLDAGKINKFLGVKLTEEEMKDILSRLDFDVSKDEVIGVPSFRDDVRNMNDVAEEIIRIYGYNKVESTVDRVYGTGMRTPSQSFDMKLRDTLLGMGIDEIQTFSFISPKYYDMIRLPADDAKRKSVVISNPLGEDTSVMRTTTIPSMMKVLSDNISVKNQGVTLFEAGNVYLPSEKEGELPDERKQLTIGFVEAASKDAHGFYRLKGYAEAVLAFAGIENGSFKACAENPSFHPGRCAEIYAGDTLLGIMGEIHPEVSKNYNIADRAYVCEMDFRTLFECRREEMNYVPVPKYPAVERDFSMICSEETEVGTIENVIKAAGGKRLESIKLFDIYRDAEKIGENMKSVAFAVMLRDSEKTMTDEESDKVVSKILKALEEKLGITLRK